VRGSYSPKRARAKLRNFRVSLFDEEVDEFERQASYRGIARAALLQRLISAMIKGDMFRAVLNDHAAMKTKEERDLEHRKALWRDLEQFFWADRR